MNVHEIAELAEVAGTLFTLVGGFKVAVHMLLRLGELLAEIKALHTGHAEMTRKLEALGVQVLRVRLKQEHCDTKQDRDN